MFRSSDRGRFLSAHRMAMDAVFIALHVVLSLFSIYILGDQIKLSFASFPLLVASLLFGMADGLLVAGIGEFLYQMLFYSFGPTTLLWMLPPMLHALIVGLYSQRHGLNLSLKQTAGIVFAAGLVTALFTTIVLYIDAQFWGYPSGLTGLVIVFRFVNSLIMCTIYTIIAPRTVALLRRVARPKAA